MKRNARTFGHDLQEATIKKKINFPIPNKVKQVVPIKYDK